MQDTNDPTFQPWLQQRDEAIMSKFQHGFQAELQKQGDDLERQARERH